jgi:ABC-2 type transport system ATP-binding protein
MSAILVEGLRKTYRTGFFGRLVPALLGISFDVARGETYGLLGANGAGKTTTIKILMGLLYPEEGDVKILGGPLGDRAVRRRIGYLPENPYFYEYLTARESLRFYGKLQGVSAADADRIGGELLERLELKDAIDRRIREYSKGMRQRFGLAQALVNDPDLIVLDEPLEGIDPRGRRLLKDLIIDLRERGKAILFSSHILADVEEISDRVCILHRGKVLKKGTLGDIVQMRSTATDLILRDVPEDLAARLRETAVRYQDEDGRVRARIAAEDGPEEFIRAAATAGAAVEAAVPLRETLEQYFVRKADASDRSESGEEGES